MAVVALTAPGGGLPGAATARPRAYDERGFSALAVVAAATAMLVLPGVRPLALQTAPVSESFALWPTRPPAPTRGPRACSSGSPIR